MSLLDYKFIEEDKVLLIYLLSIAGVGRRKVKKLFLYLKKHELKQEDFWVNRNYVLEKCNINEKYFSVIKKSSFDQNKCSIIRQIKTKNIRVICFWEKEYPKLLKHTSDFPLILFAKGNLEVLQNESISVVGTRRITPYGKMVTKKIVSELVNYGYTITSGCMYGVDQVAHQAAIDNMGKTIAVLGYGFDQVPFSMQKFQHSIIESGGCVITEYFPEVCGNKGTFPERNRIVAGLSLGVVVTEAALKSGTHITANCALDAGRDVFAVPGSIMNPFTNGTKYLINQGAKLVSSGEDIVAEFKKIVRIPLSEGKYDKVAEIDSWLDTLKLEATQQKIVREIVFLPQTTNQLAKKIKISIKELLIVLGMLELENIVKNEAGVWHCVLSYSGHV